MIAHRLSTIASAQNLLYLEDNTKLISASKGTKEYEDIIERLMSNNYAHQKDQVNEDVSPKKDGSTENSDEFDSDELTERVLV